MSKKLTIIRSLIKDKVEVERIVRETVAAQIDRERRIAKRDLEALAISEKHNPKIDLLSEEIESNLKTLEQWSDTHPEEYGEKRSILIEGHRLGYRLGQPKPEPAGKLTWKAIIGTLRRWLNVDVESITDKPAKARAATEKVMAAKYLRLKWEANKEAILETNRRGKPEDEQELADLGIEITQGEEFYLEPNREGQPEVRLSKEAA